MSPFLSPSSTAARLKLVLPLAALGFFLAGCGARRQEAPPAWPTLEVRELGSMRLVSFAQGLWFGSAPTPEDLELAQRRGIRRVIDLSRPGRTEVLDAGERLNLEVVQVPMGSETLDSADVDRVLGLLGQADSPETLMFCEDGSVCATLFAIHRVVHQGWPLAEALAEARRAGMPALPGDARVRVEVERWRRE
jgi:protein tyrosine phosphatase (PTP) superfamily phosphohydrolase (DUF442 family)